MNLWYILVIGFFLSGIDCASFTWSPIRSGAKRFTSTLKAYDITSDGTVHLIWARGDRSFVGFHYQTISPNGTLEHKGNIDLSSKCDYIFYASLRASDDGQHLIFVFDGALITGGRDNYKKLLFMETANGGKTWSDPALVRGTVDDNVGRIHPSVFLERSTGRVYVAYARGSSKPEYGIDVCMREPGAKSFTCLVEFPYSSLAYFPYIVQTESGSQKYLTLIARNRNGELFSSRSLDGKKWTDFVTFLNARVDLQHHTVISDNKVSKGGIYIQYEDSDRKEKVVWSRNHGENFEEPILVGNSYGDKDGTGTVLALCGSGNQTLLFIAHRGSSLSGSYIKFNVLHSKTFTEIPHPFKSASVTRINHDALSCRYEGQGRYSVNFIVSDPYSNALWYAYGTLSGI